MNPLSAVIAAAVLSQNYSNQPRRRYRNPGQRNPKLSRRRKNPFRGIVGQPVTFEWRWVQ